MSGFLSKIFGGKKKSSEESEAVALVRQLLEELFAKSNLELHLELSESDGADGLRTVNVNLTGADEKLLTDKEGQLLDSLQLFTQRVVQHQMAGDTLNIAFDCNGFRDEANKSLMELADKLKEIALEKGKSVYCRALPPKDRKVVHQYLANDSRVKSRSVGEGHFKKIKIFPVRNEARNAQVYDESVE